MIALGAKMGFADPLVASELKSEFILVFNFMNFHNPLYTTGRSYYGPSATVYALDASKWPLSPFITLYFHH